MRVLHCRDVGFDCDGVVEGHAIFWATMGPGGGGEPAGPLAATIGRDFGDFATFRARLTDAAVRRFGSGWAWLVLDRSGRLQVLSRAN